MSKHGELSLDSSGNDFEDAIVGEDRRAANMTVIEGATVGENPGDDTRSSYGSDVEAENLTQEQLLEKLYAAYQGAIKDFRKHTREAAYTMSNPASTIDDLQETLNFITKHREKESRYVERYVKLAKEMDARLWKKRIDSCERVNREHLELFIEASTGLEIQIDLLKSKDEIELIKRELALGQSKMQEVADRFMKSPASNLAEMEQQYRQFLEEMQPLMDEKTPLEKMKQVHDELKASLQTLNKFAIMWIQATVMDDALCKRVKEEVETDKQFVQPWLDFYARLMHLGNYKSARKLPPNVKLLNQRPAANQAPPAQRPSGPSFHGAASSTMVDSMASTVLPPSVTYGRGRGQTMKAQNTTPGQHQINASKQASATAPAQASGPPPLITAGNNRVATGGGGDPNDPDDPDDDNNGGRDGRDRHRRHQRGNGRGRRTPDDYDSTDESEDDIVEADTVLDGSIIKSITGTSKPKDTIVARMRGMRESHFVDRSQIHQKKPNSNLPTVDGSDVLATKNFLTDFEYKIHLNVKYDWPEKYYQLKEHCKGCAYDVVALFKPDRVGYMQALQKFETTYAAVDRHKGSLMTKIHNSVIDHRKLDTIHKVKIVLMHILTTVNKDAYDEIGTMLVSMVHARMVKETKDNWATFLLINGMDSSQPTFDDFEAWTEHLEKTAQTNSLAESEQTESKRSFAYKANEYGRRRTAYSQNATTAVLATVVETDSTDVKPEPEDTGKVERSQDRSDSDSDCFDTASIFAVVEEDAMKTFRGCILCDTPQRTTKHKTDACYVLKKLSKRDRRAVGMKAKACWNCWMGAHRAVDCDKPKAVCSLCNKDHHTLAHSYMTDLIFSLHSSLDRVVFRVISVKLSASPNFDDYIAVNVSLDDHAGKSFITESVARRLKCHLKAQTQRLGYLTNATVIHNYKTQWYMKPMKDDVVMPMTGFTIPEISGPILPPDIRAFKDEFDYVAAIDIAEMPMEPTVSLIGVDHCKYMKALAPDIQINDGPALRLTPLGWTMVYAGKRFDATVASITEHGTIEQLVERLWEQEIATDPRPRRVLTKDDLRAESIVGGSLFIEDGHYGASVPWKNYPNPPNLPDNYKTVLAMQSRTEADMKKVDSHWQQYKACVEEWKTNGWIERVPSNQVGKGFHIPMFPVIKEDSTTTKLRVVTDCKRKFGPDKVSLNDEILTGPKLQNEIVDVLLHFRHHRFAGNADIARMYLQFKLTEEDKQWHRIIYEGVAYQFTRWPFGNVAAPFVTLFCLNHHLKQANGANMQKVARESLYMDDVMPSRHTEEELTSTFLEGRECCAKANLDLRKFCTNSPMLAKAVAKDVLGMEIDKDGRPSKDFWVKALGYLWNPYADILGYKKLKLKRDKQMTKTEVFRVNGLCFDPVGFLEPVSLKGRVILQDVCFKFPNIDWEKTIVDDELTTAWESYLDDMERVTEVTFDRALFREEQSEKSLHVFCDASERMYSCVAYAREKIGATIRTSFITCKRKLCKKGKRSIPQKELLAAHLGAKIGRKLAANLGLSRTIYWSDSTTVLRWIANPSVIEEGFVTRRIYDIMELSRQVDWQYVNTADNPADLATRGVSMDELLQSDLWRNGSSRLMDESMRSDRPEYIVQPENEAQIVDGENSVFMINDREARSGWEYTPAQDQKAACVELITRELPVKKGYSYKNMLLWAKNMLKWKKNHRTGWISNAIGAQRVVTRLLQKWAFEVDLKYYASHGRWKPKSLLEKCNAYVTTDGIIRARGRIDDAKWLPWQTRRKIVLARNEDAERLVVYHHERLNHGVKANYLAQVMNADYYIPALRQITKKVIRQCVSCRTKTAKPLQPQMGDVPVFNESLRPFTRVSMDCCGPFSVSRPRGQKQDNRYVLIIVCHQTKAVHAEPLQDMTTDAFIRAFNRFGSEKGFPEYVRSDQGSNFVGAAGLLFDKKKEDWKVIRHVLGGYGVLRWDFSPAWSPEFNGLAETFVKQFKSHFYETAKKLLWSQDDFDTAVKVCANLLNNRPLGYVPGDPDEEIVYTPNHFLLGRVNLPKWDDIPDDNLEKLASRMKAVKHIVTMIWQKWQSSVFNVLQSRAKWKINVRNLKVDELVIVRNRGQFSNRCSWVKGVIHELITDAKGINRTAVLRIWETDSSKLPSDPGKCKLTVESVSNIIPILSFSD